MIVTCAACQQPIDVPQPMPALTINRAGVSLVIVEHPDQTFCPNCKVPVTVGVLEVNLTLVAVPVPPKAQKPILFTPNGLQM